MPGIVMLGVWLPGLYPPTAPCLYRSSSTAHLSAFHSTYPPTAHIRIPPYISMVQCAGCNRDFTASGYTSHIRHTTRAPCHAIHHSVLADLALDDNSDSDAEPPSFAGDFFGDYNVDWPDDEEEEVEVEEEEVEVEEVEVEGEEGEGSSSDEEEDDKDSDSEERNDHIVALSLQPQIEEQYEVVKFPGKHAGAPIASFNTASQPNYNTYQRQLSSDDRYAPFVSQFDWEIARWAKLRGPSSSALTELLQIDGVRGIFDNLGCITKVL